MPAVLTADIKNPTQQLTNLTYAGQYELCWDTIPTFCCGDYPATFRGLFVLLKWVDKLES